MTEYHRDDPGNVWRAYGLRANPFFQDELEPDPEAEHPTTLLIGRRAELGALTRIIAGETHSRAVVEGAVGVGKTSLVNRFKADHRNQFLSQDDPIPVIDGMEPRDLLGDVLRAVLRIRAEILGTAPVLRRAGKGRALKPASQAGDPFWVEAGRVVNGLTVTSGSLTAAGFGLGVNRSRMAADVAVGSLHPLLAEAIERLTAEAGRDVLLHVNNLENLTLREARHAADLMLNVRSSLIIPRAHWLFVGTMGIERTVFREHDQVSGFVPDAITLAPLTPAEVAEMLEARYRHLARGVRPAVAPVLPEEAAALYARFAGDLRNFLRLMSDAAKRYLGTEGVVPLRAAHILDYMAPAYAAKLERDLGSTLFRHLVTTLTPASSSAFHEFRVADVKERVGITQAAASQTVQAWLDRRLIVPVRTEGRSRYFRPSGEVSIALKLSVPPVEGL